MAEAEAVFVATGGADAGDCTSMSPCLSMPYALGKISATRRVLRISSITYQTTDGIIVDRDVYLDAADTSLQRSTSGPVLTVTNAATVIVEGVRLTNANIMVNGGAVATAHDLDLDRSSLHVTDTSQLRIQDSHFVAGSASCDQQSILEVDRSVFEKDIDPGRIQTQSCGLSVSRTLLLDSYIVTNSFTVPEGISIENSVFTHTSPGPLFFSIIDGGSALVRFNTFFSVTGNPNQFFPLFECEGFQVAFSSNIAAVKTADPFNMGTTCVVDHSLFDTDSGLEPGEGNVIEPYASILVDAPGGDYRTAPTSVALGAGDPDADILDDFVGAPRPQPVSTPPDSGAFELP